MITVGDDLQRLIARQDRMEELLTTFIAETKGRNREHEERLLYSEAVLAYQPMTPARLFVGFFKESLHVLYHAQLKTNKWKCLSQRERGKISTCFRGRKKCVRYMLCFMSAFPTPPPKDHGTQYTRGEQIMTPVVESGSAETAEPLTPSPSGDSNVSRTPSLPMSPPRPHQHTKRLSHLCATSE